MDAILQLRDGENEELRYALRSWSTNLDHDRLVVAGGRPSWLTGVEYIDVPQAGSKYGNAMANLRAMLDRPDLSDDVIVLMDDVFVMDGVPGPPNWHRGTMRSVIRAYQTRYVASTYTRSMSQTYRLLQHMGHEEPLSYSLHVPMVVNRRELRAVLIRILTALPGASVEDVARIQWRSVYGNLMGLDSELHEDVKVYDRRPRITFPTPFLSTCDESFERGAVGTHIRKAFPHPSPYEAR